MESEKTPSQKPPQTLTLAGQMRPPATPMQRLGTAEEIAAAVIFLLSPAAAFCTGQVLCVDGGISLVGYPPPMKELGDTSKFPIWGDESVLPPNAKL